MADEPKGNGDGAMELLLTVVGGMAILIALWFWSGGPGKADLRGLFLAPPAPIGPGNAYGPQIGTTSQYYQDNYGNR